MPKNLFLRILVAILIITFFGCLIYFLRSSDDILSPQTGDNIPFSQTVPSPKSSTIRDVSFISILSDPKYAELVGLRGEYECGSLIQSSNTEYGDLDHDGDEELIGDGASCRAGTGGNDIF